MIDPEIARLLAEGSTATEIAPPEPALPTRLTLSEKFYALCFYAEGRVKMDLSNPPKDGDFLTMTSRDLVLYRVTEVEKEDSYTMRRGSVADYSVTLARADDIEKTRVIPLSTLIDPNDSGSFFIKVHPLVFTMQEMD